MLSLGAKERKRETGTFFKGYGKSPREAQRFLGNVVMTMIYMPALALGCVSCLLPPEWSSLQFYPLTRTLAPQGGLPRILQASGSGGP